VLEELTRRGFDSALQAVEGRLRVIGTARTFGPEELEIVEFHRFEGISDPDDMAILYAVESRGGARGTLADAFGVYSDPAVSAVMSHVRIRGAPT
jgi:hypothetical protein